MEEELEHLRYERDRYKREAESRARWAHRATMAFVERKRRYRSAKGHIRNIQREKDNLVRALVGERAEMARLRSENEQLTEAINAAIRTIAGTD